MARPMRCISARWRRSLRQRLEDRLMIHNAFIRSISGDAEVAAPSRSPLLKRYMQSIFPDLGNEVLLASLRAARLRCGEEIDEDRRGRDHHHQPPKQIHLPGREICLKKRSHPWAHVFHRRHVQIPQIKRAPPQAAMCRAAYSLRPHVNCHAVARWLFGKLPPRLAFCREHPVAAPRSLAYIPKCAIRKWASSVL